MLALVNRASYHYRAVRSLSARQRKLCQALTESGYLRRLPKRGRYPARYVVTASGSHHLGTF